eukprot:1864806-Pyramimonas_sp.AAC.1
MIDNGSGAYYFDFDFDILCISIGIPNIANCLIDAEESKSGTQSAEHRAFPAEHVQNSRYSSEICAA